MAEKESQNKASSFDIDSDDCRDNQSTSEQADDREKQRKSLENYKIPLKDLYPDEANFVRIPLNDWKAMKRQNEEILELFGKKKKPSTSKSSSKYRQESSSGELSDSDFEKDKKMPAAYVDEETRTEEMIDNIVTGRDTPTVITTDNLFDTIQSEYSIDDDLGDNIDDRVANLVGVMSNGNLTEEAMTRKMQGYKRPRNVSYNVPKVNHEMWSMMDRLSKAKDLKNQKKQKVLLTAINSLTKIADNCTGNASTRMTDRELLSVTSDAMGMVFKVSKDISLERRAAIVNSPCIDKKYKRLMSSEIPITSFLFGDDLKSAVNSIDQVSKMGKAMSVPYSQSKRNRYAPYSYPYPYDRQVHGSKNGGRAGRQFIRRSANQYQTKFTKKSHNYKKSGNKEKSDD